MPFEGCDKCGTRISQLHARVFRVKTYTLCGECLDIFLELEEDEVLNWLEGGKDAESNSLPKG